MKKLLFPIIVIVATIVIVARLFYLKIVDDSFLKKADMQHQQFLQSISEALTKKCSSLN